MKGKTVTKPADLKVGDRIPTTFGPLIVSGEPFVSTGVPVELDQVEVAVTVENPGRFGDPDHLPAETGAEEYQWLGSTPTLRYRLYFKPDADVKVEG